MSKYEFKKFPIIPTILSLLAIIAGVFAISFSLISGNGNAALSLLIIIAGVLIFAGLTIGKPTMLRVLSLIISICIMLANFVLTIVRYNTHDIYLFATALLMLIASVLAFIYSLVANKIQRIKTMHFITSITLISLTVLYMIIYVINDAVKAVSMENYTLQSGFYPLLLGYILVTALPVFVVRSMSLKEVKPVESEPLPEPQVEEEKPQE